MSVLSYYNSCLQLEDVELLRDKEWLNDKIISFVFEFFEYEKFKEFSEEIAFLSPEVSQLIKLSKSREEISLFLEPLELKKKKSFFLSSITTNPCQQVEPTACAPFKFVNVDCPQQSNSYDCGIYVIAICEMLCLSYKRDKSLVIDADINVSCRRQEILYLIDVLKKR